MTTIYKLHFLFSILIEILFLIKTCTIQKFIYVNIIITIYKINDNNNVIRDKFKNLFGKIIDIRVNKIAPGLTDTDMMKKNTTEETINDVISRVSLKRIANPEEIANTALFLASDLSSYITGQVIRVDGGM